MEPTNEDQPLRSSADTERPHNPLAFHAWADEIRSIANEELRWGNPDSYARRRCDRLIRIAAEIAAGADERDGDTLEALYRGDLLHLSPYCGADAAIFDGEGRILLIQRKDNGLWAMPGGALEVGETPAEGTRREVREETGLEVNVLALSGVYDSQFCGTVSPYHLYHFVFLCQRSDPERNPVVTEETLAASWYARDQLPPLSPGHGVRVGDAFLRWAGTLREAVFDRPVGR